MKTPISKTKLILPKVRQFPLFLRHVVDQAGHHLTVVEPAGHRLTVAELAGHRLQTMNSAVLLTVRHSYVPTKDQGMS